MESLVPQQSRHFTVARENAPHTLFSLSRGERRYRNRSALDAADRLLVLSSKGREENISENTRGLFAIVKYEICCNKASKRETGKGSYKPIVSSILF